MRLSFRFTLSLVLLATLTGAGATWAQEAAGDFWAVYGRGERYKNQMFVADAQSIAPLAKPKGGQSLLLFQVFEERSMPVLVAYTLEFQCGARKVRFADAKAMRRPDNAVKELKVSHEWQDLKDYWVQRSFAFVCAPGNRENNQMLHLGQMPAIQMISTTQAMFQELMGIQEKGEVMDDLDVMLGNRPKAQ